MKLPNDIDINVYLRHGSIVYQSVVDRDHPGLMDDLQPIIEDNIIQDDDGGEAIDWAGVEKDWKEVGS